MFTVDASVVVAALLPDEILHESAKTWLTNLHRQKSLFGADILPQEIANALAKAARRRRIASGPCQNAWQWWQRQTCEMIPTQTLLAQAMTRSIEGQGHVYDLLHILAAKSLRKKLLTADTRLVAQITELAPDLKPWIQGIS